MYRDKLRIFLWVVFIAAISIAGITLVPLLITFLAPLFEGDNGGNGDDEIFEYPKISGSRGALRVNVYNQSIWDQTVRNDTYPNDIFGGQANVINANCKYIIKSRENYTLDIFDIIEYLIDVSFSEPYKQVLRETYDVYGQWSAWKLFLDSWYFTSLNFSAQPDEENLKISIIKDPEDFSEILNELQTISSDPAIPFISAKAFIYYFVVKNIPMMRPVYDYLVTLISEIVPTNVSLTRHDGSNILNISYYEKDKYCINAFYSSTTGMIYQLEYRDGNNSIFYSYSFYTEPAAFSMIPGYEPILICLLSSFSIIGIVYYIKKRTEV